MDPLDKVLSVLIKKLGTALQDEKEKKGRDKEEHWFYCITQTTVAGTAQTGHLKLSSICHWGKHHYQLWLKHFAPFLFPVNLESLVLLDGLDGETCLVYLL